MMKYGIVPFASLLLIACGGAPDQGSTASGEPSVAKAAPKVSPAPEPNGAKAAAINSAAPEVGVAKVARSMAPPPEPEAVKAARLSALMLPKAPIARSRYHLWPVRCIAAHCPWPRRERSPFRCGTSNSGSISRPEPRKGAGSTSRSTAAGRSSKWSPAILPPAWDSDVPGGRRNQRPRGDRRAVRGRLGHRSARRHRQSRHQRHGHLRLAPVRHLAPDRAQLVVGRKLGTPASRSDPILGLRQLRYDRLGRLHEHLDDLFDHDGGRWVGGPTWRCGSMQHWWFGGDSRAEPGHDCPRFRLLFIVRQLRGGLEFSHREPEPELRHYLLVRPLTPWRRLEAASSRCCLRQNAAVRASETACRDRASPDAAWASARASVRGYSPSNTARHGIRPLIAPCRPPRPRA